MCEKKYFYLNSFIFAICLILTSFLPIPAKAEMYYENNFENNILSDWTINGGTGSDWSILNGLLNGSTSNGRDISITLKGIDKDAYKIKFKAINFSGVDQNIILKSNSAANTFYLLGIRYSDPRWSQDNNNIVLFKYSPIYGYELLKYVTPNDLANKISLSQNVWHNVEISLNVKSVKVLFDGIQVLNVFDSVPPYIGSGTFGFQNHAGNFPYSTSNSFDDLRIMSLDHVEATPTPVQVKNKIIIIPGLGASWNTEGILSSIDDKKRDWKMASYAKNYDELIKALEDKGLVKNTDYFVWNYDWRKPVSKIVTDFNDYVNSLNFTSDVKINIVGHSLGGVVGRVWAQEHNDVKLGKVITLGSPNFGSIDAYETWNGAKISDNFGVAKIGLNVLLQLKKRVNQTRLDVIHSYVPALGDLLPVFNFVKKNNIALPSLSLFYKNSYLENKNGQVNTIFNNLEAVGGNGFESKEYLNLGERAVYDKILGYWPDGGITGFTNTKESDGTVLKKSAVFTGDNSSFVNSKHSDLPSNYVGGVFNILGLGITKNPVNNLSESDKVIFFIGSPAYLSVVCDDGVIRTSDEMGFVVVDKNNLKSCKVFVVGTGSGIYHLVLGNSINENSWLYFEDSINNSETKIVEYDVVNGSLLLSDINKDYLYKQLISDATILQGFYPSNSDLAKLISDTRNKKINDVTDDFFKFRKKNHDYVKTAVVLDEIGLILKIENKNITITDTNKVNSKFVSDKSLVDRLARLNKTINKIPSEFGANSYKMMDEMAADLKINLYMGKLNNSYVDAILGSKLANEVW